MRKKVGILTTPLLYNYGGILQAYALMTTLKKLGCNVELIQIKYAKNSSLKNFSSLIKGLIAKYILQQKGRIIFDSMNSQRGKAIITQHTSKFINKHIQPQTSPLYGVADLKRNKFVDEEYETIIVGSDQVWRPRYSDVFTYFLGFLEDTSKIKRISYAASFGVDNWEFTSAQTQSAQKLISKFKAVSVREDSGVNLCDKHLTTIATHVLDPTLLLTQDEYKYLLGIEKTSNLNQNMLLVYILDITEQVKCLIDQLCLKHNLKPLYVNNFNTEKPSMSAEDRIVPPVEEWLSAYCYAKYVLTDSFHGTVFSIIFNIPFTTIANEGRGITRFTSLLKMFNLEKRLHYTKDTANLSGEDVDWDFVNAQLEIQRIHSLNFIQSNI